MLLPQWSTVRCPVIGMLHAPALPGSPAYDGDQATIRETVLRDAATLFEGGVDGLMLENYGDTPFYPGRVPAITIAAMTALAAEIRVRCPIPLGINVLRNDGLSALAVAVASHASFIRVNVLCGARIADQGLLQGIAHDLLRERANLNARSLQIWADVDVKHSAAITARPIEEEVHDMVDRGGCDALIVSGTATGRPTDLETVRAVKTAAGHTPVLIGSGVTAESVPKLVKFSDALIVGTSLKRDGLARGPVELDRVRQLVQAVRTARP